MKMKLLKKSIKNCFCDFSLCLNLLLIKFIACDVAVLGVAAINEQQRQEIQNIKSEIAKALNNDKASTAGKNIIVQPIWTQIVDKVSEMGGAKVQVNAQNLKEAAAIRAEIKQAVAQDHYATAGAAKMKDIKALEVSLGTKGNAWQTLLTAPHNPADNEYVGSVNTNQDVNLKNIPNVINSNIGHDSEMYVSKLQRLELSKRRTREMLILKYIEEDFSFAFGAEVNEWKHIVHAGEEYFIGRRVNDLLIIHKNTTQYKQAMLLDVGLVIACIETYTHWNVEQQQQEGVIIIATGDKVLWYRVNNETKQIELYWEWMVGNTITDLSHFSLDSHDYLTISSNQSFLAGHYALNIYEFELENKEFWIAQRLQLKYPCREVTVVNTGRDVVLAIGQNNTALIYTYNPHEVDFSFIRFQFKKSVKAEGILSIAGFKMGGRSYLALTGYEPQILLYQQGDFISKTLLAHNFGLVELFFPIPVRTYRDDLLLLVQHKVDFTTHTLTVVETLIWDGEAFETSIPVPCHLGKHVVYGVGCMLDMQRDEGIKGAALLKNGDDISIIVPRYRTASGLFHFHTELLAKNSENLDLQEIFDFLKDWVKEQDDLIAQAEAFLQIPNEELIKHQTELTEFESLKTPEFVFGGEIGEIYVNDYKWTREDSNIDLELLIQNIEDLDKAFNYGRQRRNLDDVLHDELEFEELMVDELELENLNGQPFFIQNGALNYEGLVNFSELEILEELVDMQKRQVNSFSLDGDLEFDQINGVNWSDIKDNLVFKGQKQSFGELEVKGEVFIENELTINTLNTLSFPNDFLLSNGPGNSVVVAEKYFANTLSVNSIDLSGLVNEKNPKDAITLTDAQDWQGMPTFKHLEVSEILELHGEINGHDKNTLPRNPTLQEANVVNATCHFNKLIVEGPIILKGEYDDKPLAPYLADVLLKPQDSNQEILVPSLKSFDTIKFPVDFNLENNLINKIPVNSFVTTHTAQTLNISSLEGYVYFHNLTLNGTYDGVRIEDIMQDVILLDRAHNLSTTELIFSEELQAKSIAILDTINKQPIKDNLQTLQEDLNLESAEFEYLQTAQADFSQDILGQGKLNNVELHSIVNEKPWHEPPIRGNIFLKEMILEEGIQTDELHGIQAEFLLDFLNQIDELPDMVLNGQILVDHITVTGDVQLHKLNGLLFDEDIQLTALKLNYPNFLSTNLSFKNRLTIKGHLNVVGNFRGNYLPDIIDDIVVRTANSCIDIKAAKSFIKPVEVFENTQVQSLNDIPLENMAWTRKEHKFKGSVHLKGNLVVRELHLQGNINKLNWQELENSLYFDDNLNNFILRNTTVFNTSLFLEDLSVKGNLNDVTNVAEFFDNLIYKNQKCSLKKKITFSGRVSIDEGAYIGSLNDIDLLHLFNNLVFTQGFQPIVIKSPLTFKESLQVHAMQVRTFLEVEILNGCSIREWLNNTLRVDRDQYIPYALKFAAGSLDGNSLSVDYINDIDLSRIVTLNTPQIFDQTVNFTQVVLNGVICAKGLVNNINLEQEFSNTLMTSGYQHIVTPLTIKSVVVLGNLTVRAVVNGNKDLQDVANLQEDLILESPLYFEALYSPQVIVKDLITGIDFDEWFESAVKDQYPQHQYITGNWSAKHLKIQIDAEGYPFDVKFFEPWLYYPYIRFPRSNRQTLRKDDVVCHLIKDIWQDLKAKSRYIKYVEEFDMDLGKQFENINETLNKIFYLKTSEDHILLINFQCQSYIYKWQTQENKFSFEKSFVAGPIDEIMVMPVTNNSSRLEFITSFATTEELNCSLNAVNKWKIANNFSIVLDDNSTQSFYTPNKTKSLHSETMKELKPQISENQPSLIEPNISLPQSFLFGDVKQHVARILEDLSQRLNEQVNITQLIITETDLVDENLVSDFVGINEDLEKQSIFSSKVLNISFDDLTLPENPAQILTARVMQICWPAVKEIKSYLKTNASHNHPVCSHIIESLGQLINDLLRMAYNLTDGGDYNSKLTRVIERIQVLDKELVKFISALEKYEPTKAINSKKHPVKPSNTGFKIIPQSRHSHFPVHEPEEILSVMVGSSTDLLQLWAVTNKTISLTSNQNLGIHLYVEAVGKQLYQVILATQPRCLQQLRVNQETFLLYINDCCQVHILRYRGLLGFQPFAEIHSEEEYIEQILTLPALPSREKTLKYLIILMFKNKIKFYEFVTEGFNIAAAAPLPLDCL